MALRHYLDFTTLAGATKRLEIHDTSFASGATEIDADQSGYRLSYPGSAGREAGMLGVGPWGASCEVSLFYDSSNGAIVDLLNDIKGANEGRFHLVGKHDGNVEFVGYVVADQMGIPDVYRGHATILAVDGIARLKDIEYSDAGVPYENKEKVAAHLLRIIEKIGLTGVTSLSGALLKTTGKWYPTTPGISTTTCPYNQVVIDNDRHVSFDSDGNKKIWSTWDVLDAICRQFQCRFFFSDGSYWFQQVELYEDATQRTYYYNSSGVIIATSASLSHDDAEVDYSTAYPTDARKRAGGEYTYLSAVKRVTVEYNHLSARNLADDLSFPDPDAPFSLPGNIVVPGPDEIYLRTLFRFGILALWTGGGTAKHVRFHFKITLSITADPGAGPVVTTLKRTTTTDLNDPVEWAQTPQYEFASWEDDQFGSPPNRWLDFVTPVFTPNMFGQMVFQSIALQTPYLPADTDGGKFSLQVELERIVDADGVELTSGAGQISVTWLCNEPAVVVYDGTLAILQDKGVIPYAKQGNAANSQELEIPTFYGDGPNAFSLGALYNTTNNPTETWTVGGTGTEYGINELIAFQVLALRQKPLEVFRVAFMHPDIRPTSRIKDGTSYYMATRLSYDSFTDTWDGDWVRVARDPVDITDVDVGVGPPIGSPSGGGGPVIIPFPQDPLPGTGDFDGMVGNFGNSNVLVATTLSASQTAAAMNATTPNRINVVDPGYSFAKKGDTFHLINPWTATEQVLTVASTFEVGDTYLEVTEDIANDQPAGAWLMPSHKNVLATRGFTVYDDDFTGSFFPIPAAAGDLPNPTVVGYDECRRRVKVVAGGTYLIYDPNSYDHAFGIKPATREVEIYKGCKGEAVCVWVE